MKVKTGVTLYICDHCKKKGQRKGAMERHEKWCAANPENRRACEGCVHLEETTVEIHYDDPYGSGVRNATGFRCKVFDKLLYPVKAEKKGLPEKYPDTFEGQEPMPRVCEHMKQNDYPF
jgi:hypothetical protein